jgi:hypothetical protein
VPHLRWVCPLSLSMVFPRIAPLHKLFLKMEAILVNRKRFGAESNLILGSAGVGETNGALEGLRFPDLLADEGIRIMLSCIVTGKRFLLAEWPGC